ncbi:hypothetical protein HQQ92_05870 [Shewanella sp. DC2-4]|uniref:glycosyltransferase family 10 domain-containing protein n=1 Tax=Shewanella sp. DC2-4 TaxID=2739431 RepID=UPI0015676890|nr:glycosyltransferase family 10 [Shewanella sp. DC2-4]NRD31331.1 hypothetical protein [Shewanella sp. DC2-4]
MVKVCYFIDGYFNNIIFDLLNKKINRDNYAYSHYLFKLNSELLDINVSTSDINTFESSQFIIFHDMYDLDVGLIIEDKIKWLILFESEVIRPLNWVVKDHNLFDKVFTWNDDLVDNERYFKINFSHKFPDSKAAYRSGMKPYNEKKLCTLIAGNKKISHELELYSERVKTIRWFEKYAFDDFEFYGAGWDLYLSNNRYLRFIMTKFMKVKNIYFPSYPSYKGMVESKYETLLNYKFAICYENAQGISGYITEKIFDCFFAGCVPIYWGAPNITDHIPSDCFIDRRKFSSHEELYNHIKNMPESDYLAIQNNIENFIFSSLADPYRAETFANTLVEHILNDQK